MSASAVLGRQPFGVRPAREPRSIRCEIAAMRLELRQMEQRLVLKLGGMMVVLVGVMVTLIKLLPGGHP